MFASLCLSLSLSFSFDGVVAMSASPSFWYFIVSLSASEIGRVIGIDGILYVRIEGLLLDRLDDLVLNGLDSNFHKVLICLETYGKHPEHSKTIGSCGVTGYGSLRCSAFSRGIFCQ